MAYYSTHGISQFLLNNEKQRVRFLSARPAYRRMLCRFGIFIATDRNTGQRCHYYSETETIY